jgi:predicted ATPase
MENIKIESFGPIKKADVTFGDLTILVGPQASGKSIFLQLLKLLADKKHIRKTVEQYSFIWSKDPDEVLDVFFGSGMNGIWNKNTSINYNKKEITKDFVLGKQKESFLDSKETLFYIPAQRILSVSDGRAKPFTEFDESVPFCLRHFSETLRQLLQKDFAKADNSIFPKPQRLKSTLRESFNESIFHNGKVVLDNISGQKKFKMNIGEMSIPFMTWSAGQKEFMPLLLSFYWLCPSSKVTKKNSIEYVIIEEPEMGLHPQAIKSVILQIIDLLHRGYKVIVSTHSPMLLEFAWAFDLLKKYKADENALTELFDLQNNSDVKKILKGIYKKEIKTYYFDQENDGVSVKDISTLDAESEDSAISNWGGISTFSGKAAEIVSKNFKDEE